MTKEALYQSILIDYTKQNKSLTVEKLAAVCGCATKQIEAIIVGRVLPNFEAVFRLYSYATAANLKHPKSMIDCLKQIEQAATDLAKKHGVVSEKP